MTGSRPRLLYALIATLVLSAAFGPDLPGPPATAQSPLFADAARPASADERASSPTVIRSRYVTVNFAALDAAVGAPADQTSQLEMNLFPFISELFPDVTITAIRQQVGATHTGNGAIWLGKARDAAESTITLVSEGGVLVGNLQVDKRFFQIRYVGDGVHVIQEIDPRLYPDEQPPGVGDP